MQAPPDEAPTGEDWPTHGPRPARQGPAHFASLVALVISSLAIVALAWWTEPDPRGFGTHEQLGLAPCQMLAATGVPCPGCGVTTAVVLAAKGRVTASFLTQPLGLLLAWGLPLLTLWSLWLHWRGVDSYARFEQRRIWWVRLFLLFALCAWIFKVASC